MRAIAAAIAALSLLSLATGSALAQEPGMPTDARVELREGPGGQVQVVVRWEASANPDASYQVWRRTPWDVSYQTVGPYADVPRSARLPDGSYEFIDPDPFSNPSRPCYMVGAMLEEPPQGWAGAGCIPTLPAAMGRLTLSALPGPYPDSWYISGTGFAPGAYIELQEQACPAAPCPGGLDLAPARLEAAIDGRFSTFVSFPGGPVDGTRRIVAFERGWLASQLVAAPSIEIEGGHPGAASGRPISARTGESAIDRVLAVLESRDPAGFADILQFRELPTLDGTSVVRGLPKVTCGNGDGLVAAPPDGEPVAERLNALVFDFFGMGIYAVFRVAHAPGEWRAFETATHAIVLGFAQDGYQPRAAVLAVNDAGIVGVGQVCGAVPPYYLRNVDAFVLAPVTILAPATGTGAPGQAPGSNREDLSAGFALLVASTAAGLVAARQRRRAGA